VWTRFLSRDTDQLRTYEHGINIRVPYKAGNLVARCATNRCRTWLITKDLHRHAWTKLKRNCVHPCCTFYRTRNITQCKSILTEAVTRQNVEGAESKTDRQTKARQQEASRLPVPGSFSSKSLPTASPECKMMLAGVIDVYKCYYKIHK
jgi:hypothetical protein